MLRSDESDKLLQTLWVAEFQKMLGDGCTRSQNSSAAAAPLSSVGGPRMKGLGIPRARDIPVIELVFNREQKRQFIFNILSNNGMR